MSYHYQVWRQLWCHNK